MCAMIKNIIYFILSYMTKLSCYPLFFFMKQMLKNRENGLLLIHFNFENLKKENYL